MISETRIIVTMPAYCAEQTLEKTYRDIPPGLADDVLVVDDASKDNTVAVAKRLGLKVFVHPANRGYGGNQKTCYDQALEARLLVADRKSTRLNSSHQIISYAVFSLKKKKNHYQSL